MEAFTAIKCKKCRQLLFDQNEIKTLFISAHSETIGVQLVEEKCPLVDEILCMTGDHLPNWIKVSVEDSNWSRGKINCSGCSARIGSFNFISGNKCPCRSSVLPPVHIIKSKIDFIRLKI